MEKKYDIIIIGAGPSGLTAGIYASRAGMSVAIIEMRFAGGQITSAENVENYPGFSEISGVDLSMKMQEQAEKCGAVMVYDTVTSTDVTGKEKLVTISSGDVLSARAIIICAGANARKIGISSEDKFIGRGVSYCALCDGAFYKDKKVIVIGGGNTAIGDALYITKFASKVTLVHRRDQFRATKTELDKLYASNIEVVTDNVVKEIFGDKKIESVDLENVKTGEVKRVDVDGVFVAIGQIPQGTEIALEVERNNLGYIIADEHMQTNVDGVFVAGDIREKKVRQVVTAVSDGAIASEMAVLYLQ